MTGRNSGGGCPGAELPPEISGVIEPALIPRLALVVEQPRTFERFQTLPRFVSATARHQGLRLAYDPGALRVEFRFQFCGERTLRIDAGFLPLVGDQPD